MIDLTSLYSTPKSAKISHVTICRNSDRYSYRETQEHLKRNGMNRRMNNVDDHGIGRRGDCMGKMVTFYNKIRYTVVPALGRGASAEVICGFLLVVVALATLMMTQSPSQSHHEPLHSFDVVIGECHCDLISTDCLASIKCLPWSEQQILQSVAKGIKTRNIMKNRTTFDGESAQTHPQSPIGKTLRYETCLSWKEWSSSGRHRARWSNAIKTHVNESLYPFCREHSLHGMNCLFDDFERSEHVGDSMEGQATTNWQNTHSAAETEQIDLQLERELQNFDKNSSALSHLLTYADLLRMRFERRKFLRDLYAEKLQAVEHHAYRDGEVRLSVSIHIRRADSCGHKQKGFEMKASGIDSDAQPSSYRKCYDTSVYLDALKRVQAIANQQALDVYIASDNAQSLMEEIKADHSALYKEMNWYFLDHGHGVFKYEGFIEGASNGGALVESAVSDLWLLSHGRVFIGHLGSGYGKMGWVLATARFHTLIPFFSVDGHSFCCEIDEQCANVAPYIPDMENWSLSQ